MNKEEMRKAFEDWATRHLYDHEMSEDDIADELALKDDGEYVYATPYDMWAAWQARQPEIDQLKAEIEKLNMDIVFIKQWSGYKDRVENLKEVYGKYSGKLEQGEK